MSQKLNSVLSVLLGVVIVFGSLTAVAYASDSSKPGDLLYGVDKASECVQRALIRNSVKRSEFEIKVMDERVLELEKLNEEKNVKGIEKAIAEIEAQQLRLRDRLQEMDKLRTEDKLQTQDQLKVMEKLQSRIEEHKESMDKVQNQLMLNEDKGNSDDLNQVQNRYEENVQNQIRTFEEGTGVKLQVTEQEQTQNRNEGENQQLQLQQSTEQDSTVQQGRN